MPFVSITRLKVKSIFNLLPFIRANNLSVKQLISTTEFLAGKEFTDKHILLSVLTIWENENSMRLFCNSTAHRKAMQKLPAWCNEASCFHWYQSKLKLPDWIFASQRLFKEGRLSKVKSLSNNQTSDNFPSIKWKKFQRVLKNN